MKLYIIQDATSGKYWKVQADYSLKDTSWTDSMDFARYYNTYSIAKNAIRNIERNLDWYRNYGANIPLKTLANSLSLKVLMVNMTINNLEDTDFMEYKTSNKSLCLLTPTDLEIIPPTRNSQGKTYFDVPANCIAVEIEREQIKDAVGRKRNNTKTKYEPKVLALKVLVRHQADLTQLNKVIAIAQEHNVFITEYKVEVMSMLNRVSRIIDGYNDLKRQLDDIDLVNTMNTSDSE